MIPRSRSSVIKYPTNSKESLKDEEPELVKLDLSKKNIKEFPMNNQLVKSLNASSNKLSKLSEQMITALLSYQRLKSLDLSNNFLTSFPEELRKLRQLEDLKLFYNRFQNNEDIKPILSLPKLKNLDLSQNKLTSLPNKFPPKIEVLTLDFNMLKKLEKISIPTLTRLSLVLTQLEYVSPDLSFPNLTFLDLSRNSLATLPDLVKFAPRLEIINLSSNFFPELPIPPLTIREYIIKSNYLIELPENLSSFVNLRSLDVSHNFIEFIPPLPPSIISLVFSSNRVKATAPCKTPNLQRLYLRNNQLTSYPQYDKLQIKEYSAGFNQIAIIRPLFFSDIISRIDFTDNQIIEIPSFVYKLPNLTILVVSKNRIRTISNDIIKLKHIQTFNITENPIEILPPLPISLVSFYAGYCDLKELPDLKKNTNLHVFSAPGNDLATYPNAPNLKTVNLSRNRFINFPSLEFIAKYYSKLEDFDMSFNFIRHIPSNLTMDKLEELDLSFNSIKSFPDDFNLPKLKFLKLGSNPIFLSPTRKIIQENKNIPPRSNSSFDIALMASISNSTNDSNQESLANSISLENLSEHIYPSSNSENHNDTNMSDTTDHTLSSSAISPTSNNPIQIHAEKAIESSSENPKLVISEKEAENSSEVPKSPFSTPPRPAEHIISRSEHSTPIRFPIPSSKQSILKSPAKSNTQGKTPVKIIRTNSTSSQAPSNRGSLNSEKFNNLQICDITNTGIVFDKEPNIRQCFVSRRLPQYQTRHIKVLTSLSWVSFSEMKGARKTMEDSISLNAFINGDVDMYVVCDGHSGHQTSAFSCLFLVDYFSVPNNLQSLSRMTLYKAIERLNFSLHDRQFPDGSTMATVLFNGQKLVTAHIGDSRVIVATKDGTVSFETIDHKSTDRMVFERVHLAGGRISANRIGGVLAPGRSLGDYYVNGNTDEPEVKSYIINPNKDKWLIIACDGLFDVLSNQKIAEFSKKARSASELAFDLRNLAYSHMSLDNISVIVIDIQKRYSIEKQILENQVNIDSNNQINDNCNKGEENNKEDTLNKIIHINDDNIKDDIPKFLIKSAFDESESNQSNNSNHDNKIKTESTRSSEKAQQFMTLTPQIDPDHKNKTISFSRFINDPIFAPNFTMNQNQSNLTSILKNSTFHTESNNNPIEAINYNPLKLDEMKADDLKIDNEIRNQKENLQGFYKLPSSKSMPTLIPDSSND